MGFEAYDLIVGFLDDALKDTKVTAEVFACDFNEPDILQKMEALGPRLRAIIDDSAGQDSKGNVTGM